MTVSYHTEDVNVSEMRKKKEMILLFCVAQFSFVKKLIREN